MKVCILAFAHSSRDGRVYFREARLLQEAGYEVTLIARGESLKPIRHTKRDGMDVVELPRRPVPVSLRMVVDPFVFLWMFFVSLRNSSGAEVFHCHEYQSLVIGFLLSRFRKASLIYDCHEYQPEGFARLFLPISKRLYEPVRRCYEKFERFCSRRLDALVTVNEDLGRRFRRDLENVVIIPNYPSKDVSRHLEAPSREWNEKLKNRRVMVFAGYISPDRGVTSSVRLLGTEPLKSMEDVCLLCAGGVSEDYRIQIQRLARNAGIEKRVFLTGRVTHDQMLGFIRFGCIGLNLIEPVPEKNKWAQPAKVFQYAQAGLPVVTSGVGASRRLVENMGNGIIVDPHDLEQAAKQIAELLCDRERMKLLGDSGRQAFLERFNMEAVASRLFDLYRRFERPKFT